MRGAPPSFQDGGTLGLVASHFIAGYFPLSLRDWAD